MVAPEHDLPAANTDQPLKRPFARAVSINEPPTDYPEIPGKSVDGISCRGTRNSFRPAHEQETAQTLAETGFQFRDQCLDKM
jgi:hypothetical protein